MFFKRRFLSLILALFLLAGLTSCGGPPEDAGSGPSASDLGQEAQPSDQPEDPSLSQLRRELDEGGYFCGIAFLGTSQTVIRRLSPVSSVRQGIWRTTPF